MNKTQLNTFYFTSVLQRQYSKYKITLMYNKHDEQSQCSTGFAREHKLAAGGRRDVSQTDGDSHNVAHSDSSYQSYRYSAPQKKLLLKPVSVQTPGLD